MEAVDLVRDGKAPKIPQDESNSTYESWCKAEDAEINWNQPVQEIFNLIRGANPQPGAWSNFNGKPIQMPPNPFSINLLLIGLLFIIHFSISFLH